MVNPAMFECGEPCLLARSKDNYNNDIPEYGELACSMKCLAVIDGLLLIERAEATDSNSSALKVNNGYNKTKRRLDGLNLALDSSSDIKQGSSFASSKTLIRTDVSWTMSPCPPYINPGLAWSSTIHRDNGKLSLWLTSIASIFSSSPGSFARMLAWNLWTPRSGLSYTVQASPLPNPDSGSRTSELVRNARVSQTSQSSFYSWPPPQGLTSSSKWVVKDEKFCWGYTLAGLEARRNTQ